MIRFLICIFAASALAATLEPEPLAPDADYRHVHREVAMLLFDGHYQEAADWCTDFLKTNPKDAETLYFLAGAQANLDQLETALSTVSRAIYAGLPVERFIAGPRAVFRPLVESDRFNALARRHVRSVIHGPLIGDVTESSVKIWVRTVDATRIVLAARPENGGPVITSNRTNSTPETDYTAVLQLTGLKPDTTYRYSILTPGSPWSPAPAGSFRTGPARGKPTRLTVATGGGSAYHTGYEKIWLVMAGRQPDLFLALGDNVYIDAPTNRPYQRYKYYRRQSRPEYRRLLQQTSIYSIWDDHDFGTDDCSGGPAIDQPAWKRRVWEVFRQNWANPAYGGGETHPGCYYTFSVGDIQFFMPDCRYYRTDPKKTPEEERSMLGPVQKQWLLEQLTNSTATLKVLASSVPWASGTKPGSLDTWDGFAAEREEIFSTIQEQKINGVILISADRHRHDIWKIDRPGSYPLYEFESSKITNQHTHPTMENALFSVNGRGFGLFHFDTTKPDPEIQYQVINEQNTVEYTFELKLSQLQH